VYVLLRWDIGYWIVGEWKLYSTLLLTSLSVYVSHKTGRWNVFGENLHFISQSVFLQTLVVMWTLQPSVGVYYLREQILFECLRENVGLHYSVIKQKRFLKIRFSCPQHTHCVSYSPHMIVQIWQRSAIRPQECSQWQLPFHCRLHLLISKYSWCIE
jgi:hypothetical protein